MTNKIRVLIADDHEVVRSGLKSMFVGTDIKVVAEAATGAAAVKVLWRMKWTWRCWTSACPTATD